MTEKRFVFDPSINHFQDTLTDQEYSEYNLDDVVDLLNALHEENQALKSDRVRYEEECRLDVFKELHEENEQLKSEISNKECIIQYLKTALNTDYYKESQHYKKEFIRVCEELAEENQLSKKVKDENGQLKQQLDDCEQKKQNIKNMLLYSEPIVEQKKIQELIYNIVFDLIDEKIKEYQKYDGYDTEKFYIGTQLLKELKKELKGDDGND